MFKEINLVFEDSAVSVETSTESMLVTLRVRDFVLDEEKSTPDHEFYKENKVAEIYLDKKELKEVIKALQEVVIEEEEE